MAKAKIEKKVEKSIPMIDNTSALKKELAELEAKMQKGYGSADVDLKNALLAKIKAMSK